MVVRAISKTVEAYKRDKTICPSFKPHGAIPYDQRIMAWKGVEAVSLLTLAGRVIVPVRFGEYQATRMGRLRGQADLVYRDGTFFLYATLDVPEPTPIEAEEYLGVDLGIVNLAVDSDGVVYSGEAVERNRRIFAHRRRNLQRKGTKSAKRKLKTIERAQARYQSDTNHIISKRIVAIAKDSARGIAIEDLGGIRERTTVRRRQRARHANWSFFQLRSFLEYKARAAGVPCVAVDPRNTSRTCPACGHVDKANRVSQARFVCGQCAFVGVADHVAARNIAFRARAASHAAIGGAAVDTQHAVPTSRLL
jgi:putative transposase